MGGLWRLSRRLPHRWNLLPVTEKSYDSSLPCIYEPIPEIHFCTNPRAVDNEGLLIVSNNYCSVEPVNRFLGYDWGLLHWDVDPQCILQYSILCRSLSQSQN